MRVARLVEPRRFDLTEEPPPVPGPGEALVRSESVGVCASDVHYFVDGGIGENRLTTPLVLGHEPMGTVVEVGPDTPESWVGKRVAVEPGVPCGTCEWCLKGDSNLCPHVQFFGSPPIDGAFRELFAHPVTMLEEIPDGFTAADGAMLEPLGVGIHAVDLAGVRTGSSATVVGCGTIGLCVIATLRAAGATQILAIDPIASRTEMALRTGATEVFVGTGSKVLEQCLATTNGRGTDRVFEAAGHGSAHAPSMELACIGGKVVIIGITAADQVTYRESFARRKGLTIYMARRSRMTLKRGVDLIASGRVDVSELVTHRYGLGEVQAAFETVSDYRDGVVKAVVEPVR